MKHNHLHTAKQWLLALSLTFFASAQAQVVCTNTSWSVSTEADLNSAINCFNAKTSANTYTIDLTDDIALSADTDLIENATAGVTLIINGNEHTLDGQHNHGPLAIAANTIVTLNNAVITNGQYPNYGGGIDNEGTLTLNHSTVKNSQASGANAQGGGIYNGGTLTLNYSTLTDNQTYGGSGEGGGIYNRDEDATLTLNHSIVKNNQTGGGNGEGAGIYNGGTLILNDSTVKDNETELYGGEGGGIFNDNDAKLTLNNSTISGNLASDFGGGMYNGVDAMITLNNSTISGNSSDGYGGGIFNYNSGILTLNNSTISGNTANNDAGGGIFNFDNTTITLTNTLIAGNTLAGLPNDCQNYTGTGITVTGNHNLIADSGNTCGLTGTNNLIGVEPMLAPLADNGGATQTHALLVGSPAIDAGIASGAPVTDQRGVSRPQGGGIDIGAFEYQTADNNVIFSDSFE